MKERQRFVVEVAPVSPSWRATHIFLSCVASIGSLTALIPFSFVIQKFKSSCPLFWKVPVAEPENHTFAFDPSAFSWREDNTCNYCLFTSVSSFIYSFVWLWFFTVCAAERNKNMSSLSRPWLVIPPAIAFNFVMTVLIFVAAGLLTSGVNSFCEHLATTVVKGCSRAQEVIWKDYQLNNFYTLLVLSQAAMWISSFAWLFGFLVLLLRCCTGSDFKIVKVPIISSNETSEEYLSTPGPSSV